MKNNIIRKILIIAIITFAILITSTSSFAGITPSDIKGGSHGDLDLGFLDTLTDAVRLIGTFIAVGALMLIGIKYVMGSLEEKANYKKSMMPYVIGCFILFGASNLAPQIRELFSGVATDSVSVGNQILGIIQAVGSMITVGVLMILGIKYMVGSTEERASYKRSMLPAVIGTVLIFMALQVTTIIANFTNEAIGEGNTTTPIDYERDFDGNPVCRKCKDILSIGEQTKRKCENCGEPTGLTQVDKPFDYERDFDGNPVCRKCKDTLSETEQKRGACANCGEPTGF